LDILSELALIHENVKGLLPNIDFTLVVCLLRKEYKVKKKIRVIGRKIELLFFLSLNSILSRVGFHIQRGLNYRYLGGIRI
jgi:hypothetical protein